MKGKCNKKAKKVDNKTKNEYKETLKTSYEMGEEYYKDVEERHNNL